MPDLDDILTRLETATGEERDTLLEHLDAIEFEAGRDYQRVKRQIDEFLRRRNPAFNQ